MLLGQCSVWNDRLAAIVYAPAMGHKILTIEEAEQSEQDTEGLVIDWDELDINAAIAALDAFHQKTEHADGNCTLDIEFVVEDFETIEDPYLPLYPVNALRNRGLQLAETEAVLPLDVDFLPSEGLAPEYQGPEEYSALLVELLQKRVIVLPAFKSGTKAGREVALSAVKLGKDFVKRRMQTSLTLDAFSQCPECHGPTNYTHWYNAHTLYPVEYQFRYEPYVIVAKRFIPWYDERFRGYYQNKIEHLAHLSGLGTQFLVHPRHFVVHVPHNRSVARAATQQSGEKRKLDFLARIVREEIEQGIFIPVTSFAETQPELCQSRK